MSVKQLPNGERFYRFHLNKRELRRQGFRIRTEAERAETLKKSEMLHRHASGLELDDDLQLREAADMFFEQYARPFKKSWKGDRAFINVIKEFFGDRRIRDINLRDIDVFRAYVAKNVDGMKGKVTPHTVNHYHAELKAIINWAKKRRLYFGDNPAWGVSMAKVEKAKVRFLMPEEEKRLTPIVAKDTRLWPYYVLALHTGMRIGELCRVRIRDVIRYPDPMIFVAHSKSQRSRYVPLSGVALEIVANRIQGKPPESVLLDCVNRETVSQWFKECCKEAQVMDFTFHCLRHTFASYMLSRGVPIYKVSKIMGHSTVVVTEQHYGHLDRRVLVEEIKHVEGIVTLPNLSALSSGQKDV